MPLASLRCQVVAACWLFATAALLAAEPKPLEYLESARLPAAEAVQAAAADEHHVYAIDNRRVARYDRATGERLAESRGEAFHLNSGFLWQGKLYCAHSNYPRTPAESVIKRLNLETMELADFYDFGDRYGSLTWVVRHEGSWWCNFAHYGADNAKTVLVRFDDQWQEQARYTWPRKVIDDLGTYSLSGGLWLDGKLLATGHDRPKIYRLKLPEQGTVLELIDTVAAPFLGQGIAYDTLTGGLVGINRAKRLVIFATQAGFARD
jgi:hypothetical protein